MRFARRFALVVLALAVVAVAAPPSADAARPTRSPLRLTADAVVPGPGDTFASGTFSLKMSRGEICYQVDVENLGGFIDRIAIHRGRVGFEGPEVQLLSPSPIGIPGLWGCRPISRELAREIGRFPDEFYLVVTTGAYPSGALRGQLKQ
jgi:hypothetical protein